MLGRFTAMLMLALTFGSVVGDAHAQGGWTPLGSRQVADNVERDVIRVAGRERFREIRLCVTRGPVRFEDVDVRFRNGGRFDVALRRRIPAGQCSRAIDLPGQARDIQRVRFIYEARRDRGRQPIVTLFAR